ncbi:acyl-CoA dehydrogenase [Sphingopyxis lindanitolerans]|uniref:Acyl-CoA dehydrogenase n=1 Tax=Sphingopyxis lindanitolerans TaxID=2054227 RepID=A0A2S8B9B1_9SPHN|nr:acyl-CoA dehydrogenase [Sphingopyxis lindanitolerans]PQM28839.1 acyl-CoA dehydrogenase [Sphingopyxis lindanitolerans]
MQFAYNDEQQMLRDSVERFGDEEWSAADRLKRLEEGAEGTARRWAQMAELGWLMLPIAEAEGGLGGGPIEIMAIMEGLGRHLMTEAYVSYCVLAPALMAGGGDYCTALLEQVGAGKARIAAALIEDEGYATAAITTFASMDGDAFRLTGVKTHVEDGADADWYLVSARIAGSMGDRDGISLFLVPRTAEGLRVQRFRSIDGHRHCSLEFADVVGIPVGGLGEAADRIDAARDRAIVAHLAEAVGSMEAAAAATLDHVRTRQQFGVLIGTFQVVQHKVVDMNIACEEARALTMVAASQLASCGEASSLIAAAKVRVTQCGLVVTRQAVQLHGGVGTSEELIVSHHLRRQMMLDIAHGDRDHHKARFAELNR